MNTLTNLANIVGTVKYRDRKSTPSDAEEWLTNHSDQVAVEEPLKLCFAGEPYTITMRTPGNDEELAAGLLLSERVIRSPVELLRVFHCGSRDKEGYGNTLNILLAESTRQTAVNAEHRRGTLITSACGVCGRRSIDDLLHGLAELSPTRFSARVLSGLTDALRSQQPGFAETGGLHAAGIASRDGQFRVVREDIGRHNATDKAIGRMFLDGMCPLKDFVLVVSGRTSFEIIAKALVAGIPAVVGVSAPSSLAVSTAARAGMLLLGFARNGSYNVYSGADRLQP